MLRRIHFSVCLLLLSLTGVSIASAHDFWIEPASYQPKPDATLSVRLWVGEAFSGMPYLRNPDHLKEFFITGPSGRNPIEGAPGSEPAGTVHIDERGIQIIAYQSTYNLIELKSERFEAYLEDEQFTHAINLRAQRGQTNQPGREAFRRYAKSLLHAGPTRAMEPGHDRVLGFTLELIPEQNPYSLLPGQTLSMRILFHGKPLSGARILAYNEHDPEAAIIAHSDAQGRVYIDLPREGVWLIRSVHLTPASSDLPVDWESYWASLTFEIQNSG